MWVSHHSTLIKDLGAFPRGARKTARIVVSARERRVVPAARDRGSMHFQDGTGGVTPATLIAPDGREIPLTGPSRPHPATDEPAGGARRLELIRRP